MTLLGAGVGQYWMEYTSKQFTTVGVNNEKTASRCALYGFINVNVLLHA